MLARTRFARSSRLAVFLLLLGCDPALTPTDAADMLDAGPPADVPPDAPRPADVCDELGLPRAAFITTGAGTDFGDVAGEFTAATTAGTFDLSESFTGCESYVFFTHFPGRTDALIRTPPDATFMDGARNVHYFYLSDDADPDARAALMAELAASLEEGFAIFLPTDEDRAFWRPRFHFVTDRATEVSGSVGEHLRAYLAYAATPAAVVDLGGGRGSSGPPLPVAFAIDRAQAWDSVDTLSPSVGEAPTLAMAAWLGHFYNYRFGLESRLATETGVSVVALLDETTTGRVFMRDVTLPAAVSTADRLELDVVVDCQNGNPFECSEWDRIAAISFCIDGSACSDRREIARWITPYWRRGRQHYAIDASAFIGLMRAGGAQSFHVELGPDFERATEWAVRVSLRFSTAGGPRATGAELAFRGGNFDAAYNTRAPFSFTPPAGTTRVELVTILSGHGQAAGNNCAEWCDHRHTFSVNTTALPTIAHADATIGSALGCAAHADDGWIPGQWGNGAPMRAYWCPGLPVDALRTDITSLVTVGAANELTYTASFRTGEPAGGDIALSAYVVYYAAP